MTRIDEIKEAAEQYGQTYKELVADYDPSQCFIEGATWADKHRPEDNRPYDRRLVETMASWFLRKDNLNFEELSALHSVLCVFNNEVRTEISRRASHEEHSDN